MKKQLTINYEEYAAQKELPAADRALLNDAIDALKGSYAPTPVSM